MALMDFHRGWRKRADELSETTKLLIMLGTHMNNAYGSRYYGKAVNIYAPSYCRVRSGAAEL